VPALDPDDCFCGLMAAFRLKVIGSMLPVPWSMLSPWNCCAFTIFGGGR
jgi:hypothetical protein